MKLILQSAFHPKFKLSCYRGDDLNYKLIVDEMTKLVSEKLVIETDLSNSSSRSEDNHETFLNNLRTFSKTNEGAQLVYNYLDGLLSTSLPCPSVFACRPLVELYFCYNALIPSIAAVERMFSAEFNSY